MVGLFSDQERLLTVIVGCAALWSVESLVPLYLQANRLRRSRPNIALAVILIVTNLALSFATAGVATFAAQHDLGMLLLVKMPLWLATLFGIAALDLFTYIAHVLLHKSGIGWRFHRIHHSDNQVNVPTAFRQHPGETLWRIPWQIFAIVFFPLCPVVRGRGIVHYERESIFTGSFSSQRCGSRAVSSRYRRGSRFRRAVQCGQVQRHQRYHPAQRLGAYQ